MVHANGKEKGSDLTRWQEWDRIKKSKGVESTELQEKPALNYKSCYLWDLFLEIRKGCDSIGYESIKAYSDVMGVNLTPWECSVLIDIDQIWRKNG